MVNPNDVHAMFLDVEHKLQENILCQYLDYTFLCISNLVAKAPGLNLGKKISNLLGNDEALN